jgi:hypothetical protein
VDVDISSSPEAKSHAVVLLEHSTLIILMEDVIRDLRTFGIWEV